VGETIRWTGALLKPALERRIDNWRDVLKTNHPNEARLGLQ